MKITSRQLKRIIKEELQNEDVWDLRQKAGKKVGRMIRGTDFEEEPHAQTPEELSKLLNKIQHLLYVAVESVDPTLEGSIDNDEAFNQLHGLTMKVQAALASIGQYSENYK
jgi:hypothetical protein